MLAARGCAASGAVLVTALLSSLASRLLATPTQVHFQRSVSSCIRWNTTADVIGCRQANTALLQVSQLQAALGAAHKEREALRDQNRALLARVHELERQLHAEPWLQLYCQSLGNRVTLVRESFGAMLQRALSDRQRSPWSIGVFFTVALAACALWVSRRRGNARRRARGQIAHETWSLDGLPPSAVSNARSLAGQIIAHATHGRTDLVLATLDTLDRAQCTVLLAGCDLANGHTALMLAAKNGHRECCELLLARGASPLAESLQRQTALNLAARNGHAEIVELLLMRKPGTGAVAAAHGLPDAMHPALMLRLRALCSGAREAVWALGESGHECAAHLRKRVRAELSAWRQRG